MRKLVALSCALVLVFLTTGLLLPGDYELRLTRALGAPRAALHPWLTQPDLRERWAPAWLARGAAVTAAALERGVWWDVTDLGQGDAKSAALYSGSGGTRVTWLLRVPLGRDPVRRWLALTQAGWRRREMESALTRLEACLDQPRDP